MDTDIESFQIDASKIESAITSQTRALMPVHIGGSPFDVDTVMKVASKHNLPVIEDACQAHFAEWKGKKVGNFGLGGAFSFQASKNLNSGEGGAIITNDKGFYNKCYSFHHQGQGSDAARQEKLRKAVRLPLENNTAKKLCIQCHDGDNSPKFEFDTYWPKVVHPEKEQ